MVTRAATKANALANRMRQIRDRSNPATRARSASRVARRIYAMATGDEFTKTDLVTAVLAPSAARRPYSTPTGTESSPLSGPSARPGSPRFSRRVNTTDGGS